MGRVHSLRTATAGPTQSRVASRQNANGKKKPSYKVVIEQFTEKKKKLLTTVSFTPNAPEGYTFVAAGVPRLTEACKEIARERSLKVYIVSIANQHQDTLGQQINRVGYHFPSIVVEQACTKLGVSLTLNGHVVGDLASYYEHQVQYKNDSNKKRRNNKERNWFIEPNEKQEDIDARACVAIKDLFPKVPDEDIKQIISRAFQKGKARVGTAADQPFLRRVHLAVGAHIRHVYTDYDKLLKSNSFQRARALVQQASIDKMVEWRDDDKDSNEVEDILREVIVISDDEDDEGSVEMGSQREDSGEIISKHVVANDLQTRPVDYSSTDDFNTYNRPYSPDDSRASRTTYVRPVRNPYNGPSHGHLFKRQQAHRSRIWGDAVYRRRNAENPLHPTAGQLKQYPVSTEVQPVVPIEQYQRPQVVEPRQHFHPIFDDGARLDANFHGNKALALSDNVYSSQSQAKAHVLPRSLNQGHERPRRSWPFSTPQEKLSRYSDSYSSSHVPTNEIRGQDHLESSNIVSEDILPSIERDLEGAGGPIHYHDTTGQLSPRGPRIIELADDYFEAINARNENDFKRRKTDPPPSPLRLPQNREYVQHDGQRLVVPTNYQGWTTPLVREPATTYPMSSYDPQYRYDMQPVEGPRPTYFRQLPFRENEAFQSSVNSQPMPLQGRPNQVVYIERRPEDVKRTPAKSRQWEEAHVPIPRTGYIPLPSKREYVKPQPVRHDYDYLQPVQNAGYIVRSPNHWESWENHDARRTVFPPQGSQRSSEDHYLSRESSKREGTYTQSFRNQMRIDAQGSYVVAEPKPRSPAPRDFRATTTRQPIFISASPPLEEWDPDAQRRNRTRTHGYDYESSHLPTRAVVMHTNRSVPSRYL